MNLISKGGAAHGRIYTIDGQRMGNEALLPRGVYIVNGKKVV